MLSVRVLSLFAFGLAVLATTHGDRKLEEEVTRVSQDVATYQYHKDYKTCPVSLDIAYLIDGSSSVSDGDFDLQKTVVKVMAYFFGIMKLGTHGGVVVYSDTAHAEVKFNSQHTFNGFREAVKGLQKRGGATRIDVAIEAANDDLFSDGNGVRDWRKIQRVAVVFAHGTSGGISLDVAVQQLRAKDVMVFAIGVGDVAMINDLKQMVVREDLVFHATDYLDLYIKAGHIARMICSHAINRGPTGPTGPQGPDGPTGIRGPPGPPGFDGPRGNMGPHGPKGHRGVPGIGGEDGIPGAPGANGSPGPQGVKGPKGVRGDEGAAGGRGNQGDDGHDGDQGPRGAKGDQGPNGAKGEPGDFGRGGADGLAGVPGPKGEPGLAGDRGNAGRSGVDGAHGVRGAKGQAGASGAVGQLGQAGGAGSKGDRGPRGPTGARGQVGEPGASGLDGTDGADGDPGDPGSRGQRGAPGPAGPQGPKGQPGADGSNGDDGARGTSGLAGLQGINAGQSILCEYKQSPKGADSMSCNDLTTTATDCGCARGCGEWSVSADGQTCTCLCNSYVPQSFHEVGVNCCKFV